MTKIDPLRPVGYAELNDRSEAYGRHSFRGQSLFVSISDAVPCIGLTRVNWQSCDYRPLTSSPAYRVGQQPPTPVCRLLAAPSDDFHASCDSKASSKGKSDSISGPCSVTNGCELASAPATISRSVPCAGEFELRPGFGPRGDLRGQG